MKFGSIDALRACYDAGGVDPQATSAASPAS
jgi:hypothetical protein